MIEKQAYNKESEDLKKSPIEKDLNLVSKTLNDRIIALLLSFSKEVPDKVIGTTIPRITEAALIGSLTAFVNNLAEDISIYPEFSIMRQNDGRRYIADFFLQKDDEKLIIEIKNSRRAVSRVLGSGTEQLLNYLTASGVKNGILYIPPLLRNEELEVTKLTKEIGSISYNLVQIYPKKRLNKKIQVTQKAAPLI